MTIYKRYEANYEFINALEVMLISEDIRKKRCQKDIFNTICMMDDVMSIESYNSAAVFENESTAGHILYLLKSKLNIEVTRQDISWVTSGTGNDNDILFCAITVNRYDHIVLYIPIIHNITSKNMFDAYCGRYILKMDGKVIFTSYAFSSIMAAIDNKFNFVKLLSNRAFNVDIDITRKIKNLNFSKKHNPLLQ